MSTTASVEPRLLTTPTPTPARRWTGWAFALLATFSFSIAPTLARGAIGEGMDPTFLLVGRMGIAMFLLFITIAFAAPRKLWAGGRCFAIATSAGFFSGLAMLCFFWALTRLEASMASMLITVSPLVVLSLLALRGEPLTYRHGVRIGLALFGVYLLVGPGGVVDPVGVLLVLVAVCAFSVQMVVLQWYLVAYDARTVTLFVLVGMTAGVTFWWVMQGADWQVPGVRGWSTILALAIISTYVARLTLFAAVSRIGSGQMALLAPTETLMTILWSFLFLDERLSPIQWIGGLLILTSAVLAVKRLRRPRRLRSPVVIGAGGGGNE